MMATLSETVQGAIVYVAMLARNLDVNLKRLVHLCAKLPCCLTNSKRIIKHTDQVTWQCASPFYSHVLLTADIEHAVTGSIKTRIRQQGSKAANGRPAETKS